VSESEDRRRYAWINLPHARTVLERIARSLEALGGFGEAGNGDRGRVHATLTELETELAAHPEDPPLDAAVHAADDVAEHARRLVEAILETSCRGERLGQHVRNLFECLGLAEEGARLALNCGERPDSPLR